MLATLHEQFPLRGLNTFGVEARARWFCQVRSAEDLAALAADPRLVGLPRLVLGGGSNLLLTRDFDGLMIKVEVPGLRELGEAGDAWLVEVGAGENWHATVERLLAMGRPGLENLALIPGSCGAAPVQNIGAYGLELAQRFDSLTAWDFESQRLVRMTAAECAFGYRDSLFKHGLADRRLILSVTLALPKQWQPMEGYADLARELQVGVILVVGMRLGCINHALLTAEAIQRDGLQLAGWVANQSENRMHNHQENLDTLRNLLPAPLLGDVPRLCPFDPLAASNYLDISALKQK